jgi:hypothetical protein
VNSYIEKERRSTVLPIVKRAEIRRASLNNHPIGESGKNKDLHSGPGISSLINEVLNEKPSKHHHPLSPTPGPVIGTFSKKHAIITE